MTRRAPSFPPRPAGCPDGSTFTSDVDNIGTVGDHIAPRVRPRSRPTETAAVRKAVRRDVQNAITERLVENGVFRRDVCQISSARQWKSKKAKVKASPKLLPFYFALPLPLRRLPVVGGRQIGFLNGLTSSS